jgi:hypothetical protein
MYTVKRNNGEIRQEWSFYLIDQTLILDRYSQLEKVAGSQRRYETVKHYDRIYKRNNNITEEAIPLPDDVKKEALEQYISQITVKKWSER